MKLFKVKCQIRVIYADTDAMGIVYHTNYIKWFEIGRNEYLRELGYPYARLEEEKLWLPVASVECTYKSPAKYDDLLEITAWVSEVKAATVVIRYEIHNKETGVLLVTGNTRHAVTDDQLKPVRLKTYNLELYTLMEERE
jgi:acyl-CoA thioester hydrolase